MNKKTILLVTIAIILVGGYFIFMTPETDNGKVAVNPPPPASNAIDTSNWKTYRNEEYGFEVRYPTKWFSQGSIGGEFTPFGVGFSDVDLKNYARVPGDFLDKTINITLFKTKDSIEEYIKKYSSSLDYKTEFQKDIRINGEKGVLLKNIIPLKNRIGESFEAVYLGLHIKKGDFIYLIESSIPKPNLYKEIEDIFNSLIQTFKFIQ